MIIFDSGKIRFITLIYLIILKIRNYYYSCLGKRGNEYSFLIFSSEFFKNKNCNNLLAINQTTHERETSALSIIYSQYTFQFPGTIPLESLVVDIKT
jgi:hypothetical protein